MTAEARSNACQFPPASSTRSDANRTQNHRILPLRKLIAYFLDQDNSIQPQKDEHYGERCVAPAGRSDESRQSPHDSRGSQIREAFHGRRQASRLDLPRTVVASGGRCRTRQESDLMALAENRSEKRRCELGR